MLKRKVIWLLMGAALVAGAVYWGRAPEKDERAKRPPPPVPVTVAQAVAREWPVVLEVVGRGEAQATVTLKSRVDGQVQTVSFAEGRPVAAGQILIQLDPADFQARVRQAEANLARDQAQLDKARADAARYQSLFEQQFVSQEKVVEMRANAVAAAAVSQADQAALDLARQQLSYTTIRAPFAGMVGARLVHPGASVKLNDTELAVINRVSPLHVSFAVPEKHLPAIRAARGELSVTVAVPGAGSVPSQGRVVFLDNAVDPATGTLRMKAEIPNILPGVILAPGQFLAVSLRLATLHDAVVVPAEAVQQGPEGAFVYVLSGEGAKLRRVEVGQVHAGQAAISRGLAAGETVVTDGHSRLTPGAKVKVKTPGGKG